MKFAKRALAGLSGAVLVSSALLIVGASPASATTPTGGCWVYSPTSGWTGGVPDNIEDTVPASQTSSSLAPWANPGPADYVLNSGGSSVVGGTRTFDLTFNSGPTNGGPAASGTAYYFFSVNGTNLPAITKSFSALGGQPIPGDTINGSFTITAPGATNIVFRKVIYDIPSFLTRVGCNGQTGGTQAGPNPAKNPVDTNITNSFTATGPTATISSITNQTVTTHARRNDVISFSVANFTGAAGSGTAELCNNALTSCEGSTPVSIAGDGTGSGTIAVPSAPQTGARTLRITKDSDVALRSITILASPTIVTNVTGGGAGTVVTVTGSNWDPNQAVTISSTKSGPPFPPPATSDPSTTTTANAAGDISTTWTVNDPTTAFIGGSRVHDPLASPSPFVIFGSAPFTFSGDTCTAKVGLAASGSCPLVQTLNLTITAGDLKMSKVSGAVAMSGITNNGTNQTSTGSLRDVTVMDYRGGALGWSLTGKFSGLNGPNKPSSGVYTLPPTAMTWTPSCTAAGNNNDTVVTGSASAFANATTALPLCSVATTGLGPDETSGGDTAADAGLSLAVPANQASGAYTGTITLTLS